MIAIILFLAALVPAALPSFFPSGEAAADARRSAPMGFPGSGPSLHPSASIDGSTLTELAIEPDRSDQLTFGESRTYRFTASVTGDSGSVVEIEQPPSPIDGWAVSVFDSIGNEPLADTDGDGRPDVGFVSPGVSRAFAVLVIAPGSLQGDTAALGRRRFSIRGFPARAPAASDSALLLLALAPGFEAHNFPNPLADRTTFLVGIPEDGELTIAVYTRAGELVRRVLAGEPVSAGVKTVPWSPAVNERGRVVAPGVYEYVVDYMHQGKSDRVHKRLVVGE